jgi:lysozyme family protein
MRANFPQCVAYVLQYEGGYTDNPNDSGGPTNKGITAAEYASWCVMHQSPIGDIKTISDATVQAIYQLQYWLPSCDPLPAGSDYLLFDMNVQYGPTQATRIFQQCLSVPVDGFFGVITMGAALRADVKPLIEAVCDARIKFYTGLEAEQPKDLVFDKGWMNRVAAVRTRALGML